MRSGGICSQEMYLQMLEHRVISHLIWCLMKSKASSLIRCLGIWELDCEAVPISEKPSSYENQEPLLGVKKFFQCSFQALSLRALTSTEKMSSLLRQEPHLSCSFLCLNFMHTPMSMLAGEINKEDQEWFYLEVFFTGTSELWGE